MVRCPTEIELSRYLEGALPAEEARVIEQHGSACDDCRQRLDGGGDDVNSWDSSATWQEHYR